MVSAIYLTKTTEQVSPVTLPPVYINFFITKAYITFVKNFRQARKVFLAVTYCAALLNLMCVCVVFIHLSVFSKRPRPVPVT